MHKSVSSFMLILLIESIAAVVTYLKNRLMRHIYGDNMPGDLDPEFA